MKLFSTVLLARRLLAVCLLVAAAGECAAVPLKVTAIGDSNTVGTANSPGAYRTRVWQNFGSDPTKLDFLGSQQSGPFELGDKLHEGYNGFTIAKAPVGFGNITDFISGILNVRQRPDFMNRDRKSVV